MAAFNKFNIFVKHVAEKVHNLGSDTLKIGLSNTAPSASSGTHVQYSNITEISAGNGYTAGGATATLSSSTETSGTYKLVLADVSWTASGGSIGPFRYAVLYNSSSSSPTNALIGWWDYGAALTLTTGNTFTVDLDGTNGVLTLT